MAGRAARYHVPTMEPRIQYATTSDGVSIAFTSLGEGVPLVIPPPATPWSHIELEWQIPEWRHWYEHLTERCRVIRYDSRGAGLSDRDVTDLSVAAQVRDLEAVVDRVGLDHFALYGCYFAGPTCITYAAAHPERVSHLLLWCSIINNDDEGSQARSEALKQLMSVDYELFTETLAHTVFGWNEGEAAHAMATYMQNSMAREISARSWECNEHLDVTDQLSKVKAPTLVMQRRDFPGIDASVGRRLASSIPDARLAMLDGTSLSPYIGDTETPLRLCFEFIGADAPAAAAAAPAHQHGAGREPVATGGFRTIMFTDLVESTRLTQQLGDARAQDLVRLHNAIVNDALDTHGGSHVKHTGDGIMASFLTASAALDAAVAIQRAFARHNAGNSAQQVEVRIGINAGEPLIEGDDLFGTAVQLASRICARAKPGVILTSDVVRQLVAGKGFLFADHGEVELRGFEDPVRVYEVHWRQDA